MIRIVTLAAVVFAFALAATAHADEAWCPLEEWMSGPYVLYYCDYFIDSEADCPNNPKADYYYGLPQNPVPWTDCGFDPDGHCVDSRFMKDADKAFVFPGLARPIMPNYEHHLPEGGRGGPTRTHSSARDIGCIIRFDANPDPKVEEIKYAKTFLLNVTRPGGTLHKQRYVGMQVYEDQLSQAQRDGAFPVTIEPLRGRHAFRGTLLNKGILVLTAQTDG